MEHENQTGLSGAGQTLTEIILTTFRLNGKILAAGDRLIKDLGLTSALWQVMGALKRKPRTMAQIGRDMGVTRQSVRRSVGVLQSKGIVELRHNPDHQRAKLVALTPRGSRALDQVARRYAVWANQLARGFDQDQLCRVCETMQTLEHIL